MSEALIVIIIAIVGALFSRKRLLRYLHVLQQDEYSPERFLRWFAVKQAFDTKASLIAIISLIIGSWISYFPILLLLTIAASIFILSISAKEPDPRISGKLKLIMTDRAKSIFVVGYLFYLFAATAVVCTFLLYHSFISAIWFWGLQIILFQLTPFCLIGAVYLLDPWEKMKQRRYLRQASINGWHPYVIGITGSYGKTSTKNALGELIAVTLDAAFWPKGGINTLMGNVRAIREGLRSYHKYAVIEMAAYRSGSIQKLCDLTHPRAAIITAIGVMHLERFGGQEQIYQAKTELAAAVPANGILVCNGDDPNTRRAAKEYAKETTLLYGFDYGAKLDCWMTDLKLTPAGTKFTLHWRNKSYQGQVPLFGKPALSNLMGAICMACALGADPEVIVAAISNLRPVDNRLSIEKTGQIVHIKDAYNSNPIGFLAALEVLQNYEAKRRILMTPGMVELGELQFSENKRIASEAAKICDLVLLVGQTNRLAWQEGLQTGRLEEYKILSFESRDQALNKLLAMEQSGDVVLIENDLADWYEDKAKF